MRQLLENRHKLTATGSIRIFPEAANTLHCRTELHGYNCSDCCRVASSRYYCANNSTSHHFHVSQCSKKTRKLKNSHDSARVELHHKPLQTNFFHSYPNLRKLTQIIWDLHPAFLFSHSTRSTFFF